MGQANRLYQEFSTYYMPRQCCNRGLNDSTSTVKPGFGKQGLLQTSRAFQKSSYVQD